MKTLLITQSHRRIILTMRTIRLLLVGLTAATALLAHSQSGFCAEPSAGPQVAPADASQPSRRPRYEPEYERRIFHGDGDAQLDFGWLPPLQVQPERKYPLVICLHGAGGSVRASAVLARPSMREEYPAFVMVPEADGPFTWAATDVIRRRGGPAAYPEKLPVLIEAVRSLLKSEAIDPARVYVTGQSMGGVGSWGAIARYPVAVHGDCRAPLMKRVQ
jgi:predicted peptidase